VLHVSLSISRIIAGVSVFVMVNAVVSQYLALLITFYDRYRSMRERRLDIDRARNQVEWKVAVSAAGS
jgi:hypothetical protein